MKYIQTLSEKGKLEWQDSDAPDANGRFKDLSPKDLAAWLIKTRKGDMKKISGSLSQQVAFNKNDDPEYAKKMDKTRKEVYKQLDREDLLESVDMDDLDNAKEQLSNPHTILDITYDKTRRGDKFVRFDYENKYVPGKMLDSGPHFVNVRYDSNKDLKKISKELGMDLKESVLNEEDTWNDYPAAAKKNAQKAIDWKEKYGRDEVDAGTPVGWARAHQLAKGENLSTDTVKRMSAFNRHRKNSSIKPELKETPWKDRGYVAWLIWGGDEGVDWAIEKSKEIDAMKESNQLKYIKPLNEAEKYIDTNKTVDGNKLVKFSEPKSRDKWIEVNKDKVISVPNSTVIVTDQGREVGSSRGPYYLIVKESINEAEKYITDEFKVGDKIKTNFGEWEVIETDYAPNKSFIAPFIFKGKDMKRVNIPNPPKTNKNAVGYKVTDGDKYPIIGFLYQYKDITKLATVGVDESLTEAKEMSKKEVRDLKIKINNARTIGKYFTKDEVEFLQSLFESTITEASRRKVHKAAKQGSYPAVIVVVQDGKVIHQEPVSTPDVAPATFNVMQEKYPKALLHLEDKTGKRLFSESVVAEDVETIENLNHMAHTDLERIADYADMIKDRMSKGQDLDAWMYHKISDSVSNLNSVHDTMDGTDGVVENITEGIYAKESKIVPGEYIKTQYGYFYKRVEGKVGGQDAYVEIKKGKEGKRKTSIHDTVDFDIVDKSVALGESVTEGMSKSAIKKAIKVIDQQIEDEEGGDGEPLDNETLQALEQERERLLGMNELVYIKPLSESVGGYEYGKWIKENGKIKYPKWVTVTRKEIIKKGLMDSVYDSESHNMSIWINSLGKNFFVINADSKKREKEFGKNGSAFINAYYNDITGYTAFAWEAATICLELIKHIEDRIANSEEVEPGYYIAKEYFNNFGMDTKRSRIFDLTTKKLDAWMEDNQIATL